MSAVRSIIKGTVNAKGPGLTGTLGSSTKCIAKLYAGSQSEDSKIDFYKSDGDPRPKASCKIRRGTEVEVQLKKTTIVVSSEPSYFDCSFTSKEQLIKWVGKIKDIQPGILLKGDTRVLDNMIYDSIPDPHNDRGPFRVEIQHNQLLPYSGAAQLKFEVMESQGLYLMDLFTESRGKVSPIVRWQIDHLRGYGASDSVLKVETGRKTPTGPGCFVFKTPQAESIRHIIHHWASEIARHRAQGVMTSPTAPPNYEPLSNCTTPTSPPVPGAQLPDTSTHNFNPAYQQLQFKSDTSKSHYQALNVDTMSPPPRPPPPIQSTPTSTHTSQESAYQPLSPPTMTESNYTTVKLQ